MESSGKFHFPVLKSCCWLNSLRAGTLYIAVLCMVGAVNDFIFFYIQYDRIFENFPLLKQMRIQKEDRDQIKLISLIVLGSLLTAWFIVGAVLFYGAYKRKRKCLVPWMIMCSASLPLCLLGVITLVTLLFIYMSPLYGAICLVFGLLMMGFPIYFLWVVYSFYKDLEDQGDVKERGPFIVHPYDL